MVYFGLLVYRSIFNQDVGIKIAKKKDRRRHKRDHGEEMKTLNLDRARCTGWFRIDGKWRIHRLTCQRFLAWLY